MCKPWTSPMTLLACTPLVPGSSDTPREKWSLLQDFFVSPAPLVNAPLQKDLDLGQAPGAAESVEQGKGYKSGEGGRPYVNGTANGNGGVRKNGLGHGFGRGNASAHGQSKGYGSSHTRGSTFMVLQQRKLWTRMSSSVGGNGGSGTSVSSGLGSGGSARLGGAESGGGSGARMAETGQ
ncbi:hypothetical protein K438DRAFT_1944760 [Mycena galopus ATCC 62051]|nr:hypothetical protein K438DRAFT_1944760 [Mycena galopus ATCC 62051]